MKLSHSLKLLSRRYATTNPPIRRLLPASRRQDAQRDEQLVRRLTRQTEQERRLVAQLLQVRAQKEVLRENRLFREQQYQEQRERDFLEALEREAVR